LSEFHTHASAAASRVARYHQLQQQWNKDPFLNRPRKQLGFQAAFAAAHERAEAELDDLKALNSCQRPRSSGAFVTPTEKRRDQLRWDMRRRMQLHG
jgi:hypothetical protein